ncbi:MAG TPA: VOC family protein, partial [Saprospiraceae bacterium]|nr:VOC family protein [Saprospiraceae bacterium]
MKNLKISININASKQKIWKTIVDPHLYKLWTHVFSSTSYFEGGWNKGDSIRFLAFNKKGNVQGMISEIAESDFPNHISIRHLGYIENGIEDTSSDAILTWAPAYENYTLVDEGSNLTRFELDTDVDETYYEMMLEKWPKAMQELKIIAESLGDQKIYPCLWFNNEAKEAVNHYATIFQNFLTLDQNDFATSFEINGCKFMAMNGGLHYKVNSAVSY